MSEPPGWQAPGSSPEPGWGAPRYTPPPAPPVPTYGQPSYGQPSYGQPAYGQPPYGAPGAPGWGGPPRPGVVPLRPLGLGEILDGSVRTMRHNPRVMFGLSAIVMGVSVVLSTGLLLVGLPQALNSVDASGEVSSTEVAGLVSAGVVGVVVPAVVQFLALAVLNGILILAVSEAVIGRRPSIGEVLRRAGWRGVGRLVLLTLTTGLIGLVVLVVLAAPVVGLYFVALPAGIVATLVALAAAVAVGLLLMVRFAFAAPALLLEDLGVLAALRRSWRLGRGSGWRVLGILLLTSIIAGVTSSLLQVPFSIVGALVQAAMSTAGTGEASSLTLAAVVGYAVQNLGVVLSAAVVSPFSAAVVSLLYIDLRIRREGLDVALARAAAEHAEAADRASTGSGA
ncbi:hypothetical protein GCM10027446_30870 [Angustibacter peucedani]